jgi:hypothetical protein
MRLLRYRFILALSVLLACATTAHAEGTGIKLGDRLVLHLGIAAEFRYDSNVFFELNNGVGAGLFRLLPSVDLATRGGEVAQFRFHAAMDYGEYLTSDQSISQHRFVGVQAGLLATLFPHGKVVTDVFDNYVRTTQPPYGRLPFNLDRDTNQVGLRLRFRPGSGRLTLDVSYVFGLDFFEIPQLKDLDVFSHLINLRLAWKFLPKTAVYIDANETIYIYPHPGVTDHPNSFPLRVTAGLMGLITTKLTANLWVGYGNGFYVSGPSPNTAVGGLTLTWKPWIFSTGAIGYAHDFANSLFGSFYDSDRAFMNWAQQIWRFTGRLELTYQNVRYQGIPATSQVPPSTTRTDNLLTFLVGVDYHFKTWLMGSVGYALQYDNADHNLNFGVAGILGVGYLKNEVWGRLSLLY